MEVRYGRAPPPLGTGESLGTIVACLSQSKEFSGACYGLGLYPSNL